PGAPQRPGRHRFHGACRPGHRTDPGLHRARLQPRRSLAPLPGHARRAGRLGPLRHHGRAVAAPAPAAGGRPRGDRLVMTTNTTNTTQPRKSAPASDAAGFVSHARLVAALTLFSRLTGLVRDAVLAALLGLSTVADA